MHLPFYHQTSTASMLMQAIVVVCMVGSYDASVSFLVTPVCAD
jgi:hypothetical protein